MAERVVLGDRYELGEELGRGGMAQVRAAFDLRLGRPVAVKLLNVDLASDSVFRARFRREALSAAKLNQPSIVAVFDTGEETDPHTGATRPYIVMERVEGQTLRAVLRGGHQLPPQRALQITQAVLEALAHSHAAGIIHRDIKPANVMLTPTGDVKVMDFGIARAVTDTSTDLTQAATVLGTAQYLSPEQARGESVDQRSDIYSTGCLLYELLTGRPPFQGESAISVVYQHVREAPEPPSAHHPLIHPQIDIITLKALAKEPADRYQTAREMKDDIGRVLAGEEPEATLAPPASETTERPAVVAAPTPPVAESTSPAETLTSPVVAPTSPTVAPTSPVFEPTPPPVEPATPVGELSHPPQRRRTARVVLVGLLVLLVVAGGYGLYRAFGTPGRGGTVTVPSLVGDTRAEAQSKLANASLSARFEEVNGKDDNSVNTVVKQTPKGGKEVATDSVVTLDVNMGKETAVIPTGLLGKDVDTVRRKLREVGFSNVRTARADNPPADASQGDVTSIDPNEGLSLALDSRITVTFAGARTTSRPASPTTSPEASDSATSSASSATTSATSSPKPSSSQSATSDSSKTTKPPTVKPSQSSSKKTQSSSRKTQSSSKKAKSSSKQAG